MTRGEVFRTIKARVHRFCESSFDPSGAEAKRLIWKINELIDDVETCETGTLEQKKRESLDRLLELGVVWRQCVKCKLSTVLCACRSKTRTSIVANTKVLAELSLL